MKAKKQLLYLLFALFLIASPAYAVSTNGNSNDNDRNVKCKMIENKIKTKVGVFNVGKTRYLNSYHNLKSRLESLEAKLSERGYDVTKLKSDIEVLTVKINKFEADYSNYITVLNDGQSYACGKSDGEFRTKLSEARTALKQVHQDSKEIKTYYHDVIRIDLQAIKKQTPDLKQGNENKNSNTNNSNS